MKTASPSMYAATAMSDEDRTAVRTERRRRLIGLLAALCLVGGFAVYFRFTSEVGEELCFLALTIPIALQVRFGMANLNVAIRVFGTALPYLIPVTFSFLLNLDTTATDAIRTTVLLANSAYAIFLASILASWKDDDLWADVMRATAVLAIPCFVYVAIAQRHAVAWGRWEPYDLQPNWWGMMAMGLAWCSFTSKTRWVRLIALALAAYFLVRTQARGSIVAFVPALFFASGYFWPLTNKRLARLSLLLILFVIIAVGSEFVLARGIAERLIDAFLNDVMKVNDAYRGLGSGLTGRLAGYQRAVDAFFDSPIIGQGFQRLEFVHNGFLLVLAEDGLFAFLGMIYLLLVSINRYQKAKHWPAVGYMASYMLAIMTYPRSFNINMTSLLFLFVMMRGVAQKYLPNRVDAPLPRRTHPLFGRPILGAAPYGRPTVPELRTD